METLVDRPAPVNATVRIRPGKRNSLRQVLQLQQAAYETILVLKGDVVRSEDSTLRARLGSAIAQLAKGWDTLENRKRILRGRPLPGSLKPENEKSKRRRYWKGLMCSEDIPVPAPSSEGPNQVEHGTQDMPGSSSVAPPEPACITQFEPPPDAPCLTCGGKGTHRNSNFGVDLKCGACDGIGSLPMSEAKLTAGPRCSCRWG
jgi:hypothetical protein